MQSNMDTRSTPVLYSVVQLDFTIAFLHVLNLVIILAQARQNVAPLCAGKLLCCGGVWLASDSVEISRQGGG
jgi:hypothetical protein